MKAEVKYNDDGQPYRIRVSGPSDSSAKLSLDKNSGEARLTNIKPATGEDVVYGEHITRVIDYVENLELVSEVLLPDAPDEQMAAPAKE